MNEFEKFTELPPEFDGKVRLFPLPELVVFPNAMQPLHIFEPRYCEMLEDALQADRMIAMATLAPNWQAAPPGAPPLIDPSICLCRIASHSSTEDDRHNILLIGLRRATIITELETDRPFRMAQVQTIEDVYTPTGSPQRPKLKSYLLDQFAQLIPDVAEVQKNLHELMANQMSLGPITDIIGFTMQFETKKKLQLLAEGDVDRRAQMLIEVLHERITNESAPLTSFPVPRNLPFPPPFSTN